MATNWKIPVGTDLGKVIDAGVLASLEANVGPGVQPNQALNQNQPLRSTACLALAVQRIQGAITNGGRVPLSLTAGAVPPEAEQHALVLAVWGMAATSGNTQMVVVGPNGNISPFYNLFQKAESWIRDTQTGKLVPTYPSDPSPTGVVGTVDGAPVQVGVKFGDMYGTDAEYEAGTNLPGTPYDMRTTG